MSKIKQTALRSAMVCATAMAAAQAQAITISVDVNANRKAINPNIYGVAYAGTADLQALNAPLNRYGGNGSTSYNWQVNTDNRGSDWFFESLPDASATQGERYDTAMTNSKAAGAQLMVTIPLINYVANAGSGHTKLWSFSVAKYGAQTSSDGDAGNGVSTASGNPNITGNNPLDASVANSTALQQGWVQHLKTTWGAASAGGVKYYLMDNESGIWHNTHRDVHPTGAHMDEILNDMTAYAGIVKSNDASALVVGPEEWGWSGYFNSGYDLQNFSTQPDRNSHGGMDYMPWLLQNLKSYDTAHGTKSIDVFSLHYYPQSGEFSNDDSAGQQANRNKSTRSLWDPSYTDISWIGSVVQLIPRMKSWVSTYYPGLQTAITEYNWGDEPNMNGATTQADVYGIFGREGLDMASRWLTPANNTPTYFAMKLYRNYDGSKSTFGDTSCSCTVPNADQQSAFAAQRTSDNALTVMAINKITSATAATISIANFTGTATAQRWQVTGASITHLSDITVSGGNSISDTLPAQSVTLYVIAKAAGGGIPPAPTGLTATAGNTQVALAWTASTGATAYDVKRSTVNGSGYATVSSPTTTSYTNTGLTNGTTYYFVVDAKNASGTSGNSNQASATPAPGGSSVTVDDTSAAITYVGTWNPNNISGYYLNTLHASLTANSTASFTFTGTSIQWIGAKNNDHGKADVYIDNVLNTTVDGYASTWLFQQVMFSLSGLTNASHTIKIVVTGNKNAASTNFFQDIDAFIYGTGGGSAPPAPTGLTATAGNTQIALSWTASPGATSYTVMRSTVNGGGYATVSSPTVTNYTNTGLTNGTTYYFVVTAKNASGTSANSSQVSATPNAAVEVDDGAASVVYTGTWNGNAISGYYLTTLHASLTPNDFVTFTFSGTNIQWIGAKNNDHGKADVYIDGVLQTTVDGYSPSWIFQQVMYSKSGLASGSHTIKIMVTGTKNASSANYFQDIDAFIYTP